MEDMEIMRDITIGQYLAVDSFVHRMDPRAKLFCFVLLVGAITFATSYAANAIILGAVLAVVALSKIPLGYALGGLRPAIPFLVMLAVLQMTLYTSTLTAWQNCVTLFHWGPIDTNTCGVQTAVVSAARFVDLLVLGSLLTFSTTVTELTLGTEGLLGPLQRRFNFPAHELALTMTIALRFVPTFAEELDRIIKAQLSRGADLGQSGRFRAFKQAYAIVPLVVPLFLSALRRAEDLILAMEARCYVGGRGRTHFLEFRLRRSDLAAAGVVILFAVGVLVFPFPF